MNEIRKCLQCGGEIIIGKNGVPVCKYCGTEYRDNVGGYSEELNAIVRERQVGRFADAERLCKELIAKQPESSEAHWQMLLIRMGVIYELDERTLKSEPTFWGYSYAKKELISDNEWYKRTINLAGSTENRQQYAVLCEKLDNILNGYYTLVDQSEAYDIFISFKNTEEYFTTEGKKKFKPTYDSKRAEEIYNILTGKKEGYEQNKGKYKVFFSNITLEEEKNAGKKYEPKILRALQTAKAMILVGSESRFIESTWVQNEWLRYINYMDAGIKEDGSLILAYNEVEECPPIFKSSIKGRQYRKVDLSIEGWGKKLLEVLSFVETDNQSIWGKKRERQDFNDKRDQTAYNHKVNRVELGGRASQEVQVSASEQTLLRNADRMRSISHFKDAVSEYSNILSTNSKSSKAYWGRFCASVKASSDDEFKQALEKNTEIKVEDFDKAIDFCASEKEAWQKIDVVIQALNSNISQKNLKAICDVLAKYVDEDRARKILATLGNKVFANLNRGEIKTSENIFELARLFFGFNENYDFEYIYRYAKALFKDNFFKYSCKYFTELIYLSDKKADMYFYLFKSMFSVHDIEKLIFNFQKGKEDSSQKTIDQLNKNENFERLLVYSIEEENIDIQREILRMLLFQIEKLKSKAKPLIEEIISCYNSFSMEGVVRKYLHIVGNKYLLIGCFKEAEEYFNELVRKDEKQEDAFAYWGQLKCLTKKNNDILLAKLGSKIKKFIPFNNAINCANDEDVKYFMSIYNGEKKAAKNNIITKKEIDYFFYDKDDVVFIEERIRIEDIELEDVSKYDEKYYDKIEDIPVDLTFEDFFPSTNCELEDDDLYEKFLLANCASKNISVGDNVGIAGISNKGNIVIQYNQFKLNELSKMSDIIEVSAGQKHIVGLKPDRTVVAIGSNDKGQCDVSSWTDIISISAAHLTTVGLKSDGTVVATGYNQNGQCDVSSWKNIVAISTDGFNTIGLKANGTVIVTGENKRTLERRGILKWKDIVAVSIGRYHAVGLKADGTVVAEGDIYGATDLGQCSVSDWENIVAVSAGLFHTVGLKADGTVVATGSNDYRECEVSEWNNIIAISTGTYTTVGLKENGELIAIGDDRYPIGENHITQINDVSIKSPYFNFLVKNSENGDVNAQNQLVTILKEYYTPMMYGITNENECFDIMRDLAKQGNVLAQYNIYTDWLDAYITSKEVAYWHEEAAKKGYYPAQIGIGRDYEDAYDLLGDIEDLEKAEYWYEQASKSGNPSAKFYLAEVCIKLGKVEKAKQLYEELTELFGYARAINKKISRDSEGHEFYKTAQNPVLLALIDYCDKNSCNCKNYDIAAYFMEKFALKGNQQSQFILAQMYETGKGVGKDWVKAKEWYAQAGFLTFNDEQRQKKFISDLRKGVKHEEWMGGTTPPEAFIV